ncbi:TROVE domain-containing protein [Paraflavitalea speifideaquila]|uniref:TROVE domain-containing protein n=1 Tax=Paraflavitalea speifideaquila TaxID=3076558 RepID=UPI0028E70B98|nr:TROVE domain-containing protein [Paraflavitalea speifideiaquila]
MKFNINLRRKAPVLNYEGEKAFALTPEMELYTAVVTTSLSNKFYEGSLERLERIRVLISICDPAFVARLAIYAREVLNLRSIPLVLAVELARLHQGDRLVSRLTNRVVQRADEITEMLALYGQANKRSGRKQLNRLSKQVQGGLATAFNKFDEYQFAKYNRSAQVTLKDALFLVHPKAKDEDQQAIFNKIAEDGLNSPYTWEVELSALGQLRYVNDAVRKAAFCEKWEELIFSKRLGYMATLRNLRNILEANVSVEAIDQVCEYLTDPGAIAKSRQLPFRFLSAYRELKAVPHGQAGKVLEALEKAVQFSTANIAGYDEATNVLIAADVSGSMQKTISSHSKVQNFDIGLMLAMLLQYRCANVITGMFGDTWKVINLPRKQILANVDEFHRREGEVGYSTNGFLVVKDLLQRKKMVDKLMIFTDCQLWNPDNSTDNIANLWLQYKRVSPHAKLYLFDLAGYGNTPLKVQHNDVYLIAGWSEKIFDVLNAIDQGSDALKLIGSIEL